MAFAYDKTMQALGLTNSNVYGEGAGAQDQEAQPGQTQNTVVSNTEGDLSGGPQAGSTAAPAPVVQQKDQAPAQGAKNKVMQANAGKSKAPTDLKRISDTVSGARQGIQNEANAYIQAADDPYENASKTAAQDVRSFAKSGQGGEWQTLYQVAPQLQKDIELKTDTNIKDVDLIKNDAGLRELFRRGQDPEGTIGEAALDTALLRQNQGFNAERDAALSDYEKLKSEKAKIQSESRGKAQELANKGAADYKSLISGEVGKAAQEYDDLARAEEQKFDSALAAAEASRRAKLKQMAADEVERLRKSGNYDPEMAKYLSVGDEDLSSYYTPGLSADQTSYQDFYSDENANSFNRLMGLLGQGEARLGGKYSGKTADSVLGGGFTGKDAFQSNVIKRAEDARNKEIADRQALEDRTLKIATQMRAADDAAAAERARLEAAAADENLDDFSSGAKSAHDTANKPTIENIAEHLVKLDPVVYPALDAAAKGAKPAWKALTKFRR